MSRTLVMGIINVTPDSFSDGGQFLATGHAVAHGRTLVAQGADILDVGGESTRPGAERPGPDEELRRVVPVIRDLARLGVPISVDTMRAEVARAAVEAGATLVNDVSGGLADPAMLATVAELGVDYVCMHWRGHLTDSRVGTTYADVVGEVTSELAARRDACLAAGIATDKLILDPGFGFSKDSDHNWALLRGLSEITSLGHRVLVGVSRKRFLGDLLEERPPHERDAASAAITALVAGQGVWAVRTHTVRDHRDAVAVVERLHATASTRTRARDRGTIDLRGIRAVGHHGVFPEERVEGQVFLADVTLHLGVETRSDALTDTVDYSVVARDIAGLIAGDPVDLIETLAGRIADRCLSEPLVERVDVSVHKPDAAVGVTLSDIAVTIHRGRP